MIFPSTNGPNLVTGEPSGSRGREVFMSVVGLDLKQEIWSPRLKLAKTSPEEEKEDRKKKPFITYVVDAAVEIFSKQVRQYI